MDLDGFLRFHRLERAEVEQRLIGALSGEPGEVAYLAGSLVEGLGNHRSDLDVYVISGADPAGQDVFGSASIMALDPIAADIEIVSAAQLEAVIERLRRLPADDARDPRLAPSDLSDADLKLLHNLRLGVPIRGAERFAQWAGQVDDRSLSRVLLDRAVAWMGVLHLDILGFLEAGDEGSARAVLRTFRVHLAGALLAGLGVTNAGQKWQIRLLDEQRVRRGEACLPGGRRLGEAIDRWEALDSTIGTAPVDASLRALLSLYYAIVPWAQNRFLAGERLDADGAGYPPGAAPASDGGEQLPALSLDCQIQRDARGIWVSRLSSPDLLYVNAFAHELLMHFDGRSSAAAAVARLEQVCPARPDEIARSLADFRTVLADRVLI